MHANQRPRRTPAAESGLRRIGMRLRIGAAVGLLLFAVAVIVDLVRDTPADDMVIGAAEGLSLVVTTICGAGAASAWVLDQSTADRAANLQWAVRLGMDIADDFPLPGSRRPPVVGEWENSGR